MSQVQVVATIPVRPDRRSEALEVLGTLVEATRAEEGCLAYDLFESAAAPDVFVMVERYADQAALDAHMSSEHLAAAFAAAQDLLAGEVAIHPLVPVVAA
ncbi:putative quinol monooxygenase [Phycicoccus flavus]|uniref:putative quinol monooxygenase n=1 Tax=Phycicoccus flavus TaxID=2502783 RepID=UPI000FEB686F|nr:putative quinol monooxygenase [Phycicoccus flavus]NHA66508.1 antibiotic biosynthesis monooxygenase [Phycicoccus flavus]